jgi:hypothetical protein
VLAALEDQACTAAGLKSGVGNRGKATATAADADSYSIRRPRWKSCDAIAADGE